MADPFRSLKFLPWQMLLQSAAVTIAIATVLDYLLLQGLILVVRSLAQNATISFPLAILSFLNFLAPLAAAYGIGALAIFITARFFREIFLRANTIWALVGCVILFYWIRTLLPVPGYFMQTDTFSIVAIALGAFFSSKRYWRY